MNVMSRFTLRSMRANRRWTVVTLIGIILSTAMLSAVSTFCASFLELMRSETIAQDGNWHAIVSEVPMEKVPAFREAGFIEEVALSHDLGYARLEASKNPNKPYLFIRQWDEASSRTFPTHLLEGRMPQNSGELVIPQHLTTNGGVRYALGETITLEVGRRVHTDGLPLGQQQPFQEDDTGVSEALTDTQIRTFTVVGVMERPGFEPTWAPGYTAISALDTGGMGADEGVSVTLLAQRLSRGTLADVQNLVRSVGLSADQIEFNTELLRYHGIVGSDSTQNTLYGFAAVFTAIIIVASVSLIYNAFAISVSERISQLGMLASVGATRRQKRHSIYFEGLLLGAVGIPLGLLSGVVGIGVTLSVIRPLLASFMTFSSSEGLALHVSALSIAAAALLAALTIFVSVWVPARRASKVMPIDAIRQQKEVRLTRRAVKTSPLTRALFGFEGEIALKNLRRSRRKYRATVLSLTISLVLFLTVSYYAETIGRASDTVESGVNFDLNLTFLNLPTDEAEEVFGKIAALEGVEEAAVVESAGGVFAVDSTQLSDLTRGFLSPDGGTAFVGRTLYCLDDAAFDRYAASLGLDPGAYRDTAHPRMILINYGKSYLGGKPTAGEPLSVRPGDSLTLLRNGDAVGDSAAIEVGHLTKERPMGVLVSPLGQVSAVVSRQVFDTLPQGLKSIDSDGNPSMRQMFLRGTDTDTLETKLLELTQGLSGRTYLYNVASEAQMEQNLMLVLGIFIYGFITLISLICVANIFNTVTTNIALRRREFAMLRSAGMTPGSFNRMIRFESIFYGLNALMWGLPISFGISVLLYRIQDEVFRTPFVLPWASYGVAVVLIFLIVGATMLYSGAQVKRENIIDALKTDMM